MEDMGRRGGKTKIRIFSIDLSMVVHTFNSRCELKRGKVGEICELATNLVYIVSSRIARMM